MMIFGGRRKEDEQDRTIVSHPDAETPTRLPPMPVTSSTHNFETVLGSTSVVEGTLECQGNIRLDGSFTGKLGITGNVLVGETATINANIHANNISIAGTVRGNVSGKRVQLLRTGKVWGDITAASLTTEEGAFIDGKVSMAGQQQPVDESGDMDGPTLLIQGSAPKTDEPAADPETENESKDD